MRKIIKEIAKIFIGKNPTTKTIKLWGYQLTITFGEIQIQPINKNVLSKIKDCDCVLRFVNSRISVIPKIDRHVLCSIDYDCQKELLKWFERNFPKILKALHDHKQ